MITDPPYGIGFDSKYAKVGGTQFGKAKAKKQMYHSSDWDNSRIDKKYFDLMFQCSKNQIIFGANYYMDMLPSIKSFLCWDKRCEAKMQNDFADCEYMWCSQGQARIFRYLYNGMIQGDMHNKDERFHPTQKPTQLIIQLLNYYTKENDLILDPFSGSASISIASRKLNRYYIASELDKEYYDKSIERMDKEFSQLSFLYE